MSVSSRAEIANESSKKYSSDKMVSDYYTLYNQISDNKKILEIDVNYKFSSTGKIVYDIKNKASIYGKEVVACYGRGKSVAEENVYKFGYDIETCVHALLSRITGYNGCFSYFSTRRLIKIIKEFKPDLIHIHELHAYFVNISQLLIYIKKQGIPVVWTFHCEYMYTGKCGHAYDCKGYLSGCGNCPTVNEYPKSLLFDKTSQMFKLKKQLLSDMNVRIVTPSRWLEDRVRTSYLANKEILTINNGVDTNVFHYVKTDELKTELGIKNDRVALFVSPDISDVKKGIDWIIKLAEDTKDIGIRYLVVGGGDYTGSVSSNVSFIGSISDKKVLAQYYSLADVYLLCSMKETYSMTCAESLCCGTPVVGFECGAPETVFEGDYVKFVPYGDYAYLKEEMIMMLERYK